MRRVLFLFSQYAVMVCTGTLTFLSIERVVKRHALFA